MFVVEQKGNCCAKALILLLAFNQAGWGGLGGSIEMQMLMTVAEDNHSRSAQAQCDRVDAVCRSQQNAPTTCCHMLRPGSN